jgi:hypothetical protein
VAQQLSAQVWPYIAFTGTTSPVRLELDLENDGLGPAIVQSFVVSVDGKPRRDWRAVLRALIGDAPTAGSTTRELATISSGDVVRPGVSEPIIRVAGDPRTIATFLRTIPSSAIVRSSRHAGRRSIPGASRKVARPVPTGGPTSS